MKVKDFMGHVAMFSSIKEVKVIYRLKEIDSLPFPDCLPYRNGNKYEKATLNSAIINGNVLKISIENNY